MTKWMCAIGLCLWATAVQAQTCTANCFVYAGDPFFAITEASIGADPELVIDAVPVVVPYDIENGLYQFRLNAGLSSLGPHTMAIRAKGATGTVRTEPFTLMVLDYCAVNPLRFLVLRWPAAATGRRRYEYETNRPSALTLNLQGARWVATAQDARGCRVERVR